MYLVIIKLDDTQYISLGSKKYTQKNRYKLKIILNILSQLRIYNLFYIFIQNEVFNMTRSPG